MTLPTITNITPAQYDRLMKYDDQMRSINNMMQMFQKNCEARLQQTQMEVRQTWEEIAREQQIDITNIVWVPHPTEKGKIMPVQMRFQDGQAA